MPFRNDQLVGCLTDMQNLEGDLEDLINDQNQHQYNRYLVDSGQLVNQSGDPLSPQQLLLQGGGSNQFEPMGYLLAGGATSADSRAPNNFDFNTADFSKQQPSQLGYSTTGNLADPFDDIDDELELHHLKELEGLMETGQSGQMMDDLSGSVSGPASQCTAIGGRLGGNRVGGANLPAGLSVGINSLPGNLQPAQAQQQPFLVLANQQQQPARANSHPASFENSHSSFSTIASAQIAGAHSLIQSPSSIQVI